MLIVTGKCFFHALLCVPANAIATVMMLNLVIVANQTVLVSWVVRHKQMSRQWTTSILMVREEHHSSADLAHTVA